jgi:hypothetical protein
LLLFFLIAKINALLRDALRARIACGARCDSAAGGFVHVRNTMAVSKAGLGVVVSVKSEKVHTLRRLQQKNQHRYRHPTTVTMCAYMRGT